MIIGIDGNMWYCSNGLDLDDPRARFSFERTLREAVIQYQIKFSCNDELSSEMLQYADMTTEEYKRHQSKHVGDE